VSRRERGVVGDLLGIGLVFVLRRVEVDVDLENAVSKTTVTS